jgi:hypothetical protein
MCEHTWQLVQNTERRRRSLGEWKAKEEQGVETKRINEYDILLSTAVYNVSRHKTLGLGSGNGNLS